ncbi:DUF7835 family putative zinc beta-ribbon protein [Haladaptatus sp. NG-SE-30]
MSTTQSEFKETTEQCDNCATKTHHRVSVELITESDKEKNAAFSREPYRITECTQCGTESHQRVNNI